MGKRGLKTTKELLLFMEHGVSCELDETFVLQEIALESWIFDGENVANSFLRFPANQYFTHGNEVAKEGIFRNLKYTHKSHKVLKTDMERDKMRWVWWLFFCRFLCGIPILHYAFRSLIPRESDVIWCQKRFTGVHWQISSVFGCHFCWFRFEYAEPLVYRKSIFRDFRGMIQWSIKLPHWGLKPAKEVQVMIVFSNGKSIQIEHLKAFKCF